VENDACILWLAEHLDNSPELDIGWGVTLPLIVWVELRADFDVCNCKWLPGSWCTLGSGSRRAFKYTITCGRLFIVASLSTKTVRPTSAPKSMVVSVCSGNVLEQFSTSRATTLLVGDSTTDEDFRYDLPVVLLSWTTPNMAQTLGQERIGWNSAEASTRCWYM